MAITSNVGGVLKTLQTIHSSVGGTLKELQTIHSSVGGTLKQIHSSEKCLDINIASLSSTVPIGTYTGFSYPNYSYHTPYKIYLPDFQTASRVDTDFNSLSSDFNFAKQANVPYYANQNFIAADYIEFVGMHNEGGSQYGGGGQDIFIRAKKDGLYLCIYLNYSKFTWNASGVSCNTNDITTPLKAKIYYK